MAGSGEKRASFVFVFFSLLSRARSSRTCRNLLAFFKLFSRMIDNSAPSTRRRNKWEAALFKSGAKTYGTVGRRGKVIDGAIKGTKRPPARRDWVRPTNGPSLTVFRGSTQLETRPLKKKFPNKSNYCAIRHRRKAKRLVSNPRPLGADKKKQIATVSKHVRPR